MLFPKLIWKTIWLLAVVTLSANGCTSEKKDDEVSPSGCRNQQQCTQLTDESVAANEQRTLVSRPFNSCRFYI